MKLHVLELALGCCWFVSSSLQQPGPPALVVRVNDKGIGHFTHVGEQIIKDIILHMKFPTINYAEGSNRFEARDMVILRYTDPRIYHKLVAPNILKIGIKIKRLEVRAKYEAKRILITSGFMDKFKKLLGKSKGVSVTDHGVFGAQVGNYNMWLKIALHKDASGRFLLVSKQCMATMGDFIADVKTSRLVDWMIGKMSEKISEELEPILADGICKAVNDYVNKNTNAYLQTIPVLTDMLFGFYFDSALTEDPTVRPEYLETKHSAEVIYTKNIRNVPRTAPFRSKPIPPQAGGPRMIYAWGTEYIVNSAMYHAHKGGLLSVAVNKRELPDYASYLATDCGLFSVCLASLWPNVGTKYPGAAGAVQLGTVNPPKVVIKQDGIDVIVKGFLKINLETPTGGPTNPEKLLDSTFDVEATLVPRIDHSNNFFKGLVVVSKMKFDIIYNALDGGLSREQFEKMLGQVTRPIAVAVANSYLGPGFEIPDTLGVHLHNPDLVMKNGFFELGTDVNYTLPFDPKILLGEAIRGQ